MPASPSCHAERPPHAAAHPGPPGSRRHAQVQSALPSVVARDAIVVRNSRPQIETMVHPCYPCCYPSSALVGVVVVARYPATCDSPQMPVATQVLPRYWGLLIDERTCCELEAAAAARICLVVRDTGLEFLVKAQRSCSPFRTR